MRLGAGVAPLGLPAAVRETLQIFWESPFPATLQDEHFRLVDVNDAFVAFSGFTREAAEKLMMSVNEINRAELRALMAASELE